MRWLIVFFNSSIGKKLIMSLTGLFLITFLIVHLIGNLLLLLDDGGQSFNEYAYMMTTNPLIKFVSIGLYAFILIHAVQGVFIALYNSKSKGTKYAVKTNENASWVSKNMIWLGVLLFAFICLHMGDFWYKMKFTDQLPLVEYGSGIAVKDLYTQVYTAFKVPVVVIVYLIGLLALALHLWHGFQSAFTSLGVRSSKYTPIIRSLGKGYSVIIPLLFALIPLYVFFTN